jgi:hypothetical protein
MAKRQRVEPKGLTPEELQLLAQGGFKPINKDEVQVYKGNEQGTMASVGSPAYARYPVNTVTLIGDLAAERKQPSRYPAALEFSNTVLTGIVTAVPVADYEETKPNQYRLLYNGRKNAATQDLLPILGPRNMQVNAGYVLEIPISAAKLDGQYRVLVFHLNQAQIREEEEGPPRTRKKKDDAKKDAGAKKVDGATKDDQSQAQRDTAASGENPTK